MVRILISERELATLLVALRHWQQSVERSGQPDPRDWPQFATRSPLASIEIDALYQAINRPSIKPRKRH